MSVVKVSDYFEQSREFASSRTAQWNNPYFAPSRPPGRFIFGESVTSQASILISIHYEFVTNIAANFAVGEYKVPAGLDCSANVFTTVVMWHLDTMGVG